MNYFWNELEMKRGVELLVIGGTCLPTPKWKDPEALGRRAPPRPGPRTTYSGLSKRQTEHEQLNLVVFLFLSSHKYRQRTENDSFPS